MGNADSSAAVIPEGDAKLAACLGRSQEDVTAVASGVAACASAGPYFSADALERQRLHCCRDKPGQLQLPYSSLPAL